MEDLKKQLKNNCSIAIKNPTKTETMDFCLILGDSIKDKYETIMLECIRICRELKYNFMEDFDEYWVCASPEISSIFETTKSFNGDGFEYGLDLNYVGSINFLESVVHFLNDVNTQNKIDFYIGCGDKCVKIIFINFII